MGVEVLVLDSDGGVLGVVRDLLKWDHFTPDVLREVVEEDLAGAVVDLGRLVETSLCEALKGRDAQGGHPQDHSSC